MPRETKDEKAMRYLCEGRVVLVHVSRSAVTAHVRGEGAVYRTRWEAGAWSCTCPHGARTTDCSHVAAVKRVTAVDLEAVSR